MGIGNIFTRRLCYFKMKACGVHVSIRHMMACVCIYCTYIGILVCRKYQMNNIGDTISISKSENARDTHFLFQLRSLNTANQDEQVNVSVDNGNPLFRINFTTEESESVQGTPISTLNDYKNPCWKTKLSGSMALGLYDDSLYRKGRCTGSELDHCEYDFKRMREHYTNRIDSEALHTGYGFNETVIWRLRCMPSVYLGGVTKSGTTDLFYKLLQHPDIASPSMKEPMYLNRNRLDRNPYIPFSQYVDLFDSAALQIERSVINTKEKDHFHNKITLDASPNYLWDHGRWRDIPGYHHLHEPNITLAHTIHAMNPNARFIFILRDPVARFHSHFRMKQHTSKRPFSDAAQFAIKYFKKCNRTRSVRSCAYDIWSNDDSTYEAYLRLLLNPSLYSVFLKDYFNVFPKNQILVVRSEEYFANRSWIMGKITDFLGLSPYTKAHLDKMFYDTVLNRNNHNGWIRIPDEVRKTLNNFFHPFNEELAKMLGRKSFF